MFKVQVEQDFSFLSGEYRALFADSQATAFQAPVWLEHLYSSRLLSDCRAERLVVTVRNQSGRLLMVLPLVRRRPGALKVVEFVDFGVSDYGAPVCRREDIAVLVSNTAWRARVMAALRPFDLLRLTKLSRDFLPLTEFLGARSISHQEVSSYSVALDLDFPKWRLARMDGSLRKQLDKKRRQLARAGSVRFEVVEEHAGIADVFAEMRDFRWERFHDGKDAMQNPAAFDFYLGVAKDGAGAAQARTYALWLDDDLIAAAFGLAHAGTFLVVLSGFDQRDSKRFSPGLLCMEDVIRDCIERGERHFDLTIGDEGYKKLFGAGTTPLSSSGERQRDRCGGRPRPGAPLGGEGGSALGRWLLGNGFEPST